MKMVELTFGFYDSKIRMHSVSACALVCLVQQLAIAPYKCSIREQDHKKWLTRGE